MSASFETLLPIFLLIALGLGSALAWNRAGGHVARA